MANRFLYKKIPYFTSYFDGILYKYRQVAIEKYYSESVNHNATRNNIKTLIFSANSIRVFLLKGIRDKRQI